ncbi:MAG: DNA/RNA helicase domain-containing protein, partial [Vulcanimicrobiaceae bacterium]
PGAAAPLEDAEFSALLSGVPLFLNHHADKLKAFFAENVGQGNGMAVMERAITAKHAPSRKLLENTAALVKGEPRYKLIDDQVIAYNAVLAMVRRAQKDKRAKAVVAVHGGPGTGKSVIALNLLGELSRMGVNVQHATGSKAFTGNLWRILGSKSKAQVRYFNNFGMAESGSVDVILADEAHRIRESSNTYLTPKARRTDRLQIDELIDASKVTVFFLDDFQAVRPGEIGSMRLIQEAAARHEARYESIDLRTQFRCGGSAQYIDWVDQLLEVRKTGEMELEVAAYDFSICDSPTQLETYLADRIADGYSARMMAGFCWPWSKPTDEGVLVNDVVIDDFRRPWNARPEATRLAKNIPSSIFWASDPNGFAQVGCIYTAQGFEFDYAGVIWANDLVIRDGKWVGQPSASHDGAVKKGGARFVDIVKNAYRVLLTRGMRGCSVYIIDDETRAYVSKRLLRRT